MDVAFRISRGPHPPVVVLECLVAAPMQLAPLPHEHCSPATHEDNHNGYNRSEIDVPDLLRLVRVLLFLVFDALRGGLGGSEGRFGVVRNSTSRGTG